MDYVDISNINKQHLLWQLLRRAESPRFSNGNIPSISASDVFREAETKNWNFDHLQGRVLRCDISGDTVDVREYDSHNGKGAFQECVDIVRGIPM